MQEYQINNSEIGQTVSDITDLPPLKTYVTDTVQPVIVVNPSGVAQDVNIDSVTLGATIGVDNKEYTVSSLTGVRTTAGSVTLGTVPAGKTWYILTANLNCWAIGNAGQADLFINGVSYITIRTLATATITMSGHALSWNMKQCPKATAGQTIVLTTTAQDGSANVSYIEV